MSSFVLRVVPVAVTLWLAACGAGGNNNIFDLHPAGGGAGDSSVLRVGVESTSPRAAPSGDVVVTGAVNASTRARFSSQG
jgi:hypothetical protein